MEFSCKNALTKGNRWYILDLRKRKKEGGEYMFNKNKFKAQLVLKGYTMKDVAEALGINVATIYRKVNADGDFSRKEINTLIDILEIQNPSEIFFDDELA